MSRPREKGRVAALVSAGMTLKQACQHLQQQHAMYKLENGKLGTAQDKIAELTLLLNEERARKRKAEHRKGNGNLADSLADLCEWLADKSKEHKILSTLTGYSCTGDAMATHQKEWAETLDSWITQIQSLSAPASEG